jgi:hypothetical protein
MKDKNGNKISVGDEVAFNTINCFWEIGIVTRLVPRKFNRGVPMAVIIREGFSVQEQSSYTRQSWNIERL